jgi:hypothetical protein
MSENPTKLDQQMRSMQIRLDLLERENQQLRDLPGPIIGPQNPCFDAIKFRRVFNRIFSPMFLPMILTMFLPMVALPNVSSKFPILHERIAHIPIVDLDGMNSGIPGVGLGIVAFGGASLGVIAIGGLGIGLLAYGGGSIGVIAIGGGAVGVIAIGGGACGYIAFGGGAYGYYALGGQRAYGKYVLSINRQDDEAIAFFSRFIPGLKEAVTLPMPVILLDPDRA